MKILVTGCKGQVGNYLTEKLSNRANVELWAVGREDLDVTNQQAVHKAVAAFKPTIIINAAAHTAVDKAETEIELSYAINRDGPKYLAEAAQKLGAAIIHISTDYVFEGNKDGEYLESDKTNPQGVYGASKLAGELAVAQSCEKHIILRTAWVFGETGSNFVKTMMRFGANRDQLSVVGDQFGGPTYAGDIANALIKIAQRITDNQVVQYGVYHYSGLPHVSWFEFAEVIFNFAVTHNALDKKPQLTCINTDQYPTLAKRPSNSKLSTRKIIDAFAIQPSDWKFALNNINAYKA